MRPRGSKLEYEDTEEVVSNEQPYLICPSVRTVQHFDIYLSRPIEEPPQYDELCHLLHNLDEEDTVRLYLNTEGGEMSAGLAIINAMRSSQAQVTTVLNPQAYSMGALIYLSGDDWELPPNSMLMFHHYSGGLMGKGNEQAAEVQASNAWFSRIMADLCKGFLSTSEIHAITQGKDLWLGNDEIAKRLVQLRHSREGTTRRPRKIGKAVASPSTPYPAAESVPISS